MRIKLFILLALAASFANAQPLTYIKTSSLIDGRSDAPKQNQVIVIRGNRIESVATATAIPDGARVIDLTGMTVMPGLIDSHTHIFLQGEDPAEGGYDVQLLKYPLAYRAARATVSAKRALDQGFTTVRDVETEGAGTAISASSRQSTRDAFPARASSPPRAASRPPAATTSRDTRRRSPFRRACRSSTARSRRARPRASSSSAARTGSRFT